MDARHVCEHARDCSVWKINPHTKPYEQCRICDCGALKRAIHNSTEDNDDLWKALSNHVIAIDKSMGM